MSNKIITLEITEKEYENYLEYCKLVNTNCEEDLIEYLKARSEEVEKFISRTSKKIDKHSQENEKNISKNNLKLRSNSSRSSTKEKYISLRGNHYIIRKRINGSEFSFGSYKTLEEAIERRNFLIKENWNEKYSSSRKK